MRVAVASRSFSRHPQLRSELLAKYPGATFNDAGVSLAGEALAAFLEGHDAAIIALERITDDVLARLPKLKIIAKYGVGLDGLDLAAMARRGVRLGWTPGVNRRSVAELVIACAIALLRHVPLAMESVRRGEWRQLMGRQLSARTVGIVGCGHVGKDVAILARAFGCRVLANDIKDYAEFYRKHDITPVDLEALLAESGIVTLHTPLDASTRNILSAERLALMKPDAILINTARGGLVDDAAVKDMLRTGRLAGAAFDVFEKEPPEDFELLRLPNFIALPHIGGSSEEAVLAMGRAAIEGLSRNGDPFGVAGLARPR